MVENTLAMDIFGTHVNRSARLEAIANGGQVITSQSVWENAAGWIKDHEDINIGCIEYGKVKLKGIEKAMDVYGFYPKELGKPKPPTIVSKKKKKSFGITLASIVAVVLLGSFLFKQLTNKNSNALQSDSMKSYYVQFDFSKFNNPQNKFKVDTLLLQKKILTQIISVLSPDSVVTEDDVIKQFSKNGKLYIRHPSNDPDSNATSFFKDTLHVSATLFIKAGPLDKENKDSIWMDSRLHIFDNADGSSSFQYATGLYGLPDAGDQLGNYLQDMLLSLRKSGIQGYVINSKDSILFFRKTKDAQLRQGSAISLGRVYKEDKEGLTQRLNDLKVYLNYYKNDSDMAARYKGEYSNVQKELDTFTNRGDYDISDIGIEIEGQVIEMYDSIGKALWHTTGLYPEKPKIGDAIHYK